MMEAWMKPIKPWIKKGKVSSWFSDKDRDGVANIFDCQPRNKKKQDIISVSHFHKKYPQLKNVEVVYESRLHPHLSGQFYPPKVMVSGGRVVAIVGKGKVLLNPHKPFSDQAITLAHEAKHIEQYERLKHLPLHKRVIEWERQQRFIEREAVEAERTARFGMPAQLFDDKDKDGVPNVFDCQPNNPRKQGWNRKAGGWRATDAEAKAAYNKLRQAGMPRAIARRVRGWRPKYVQQVIEGKRYNFDVKLEKERIEMGGNKSPEADLLAARRYKNKLLRRPGGQKELQRKQKEYYLKNREKLIRKNAELVKAKSEFRKAAELIEKRGPQLETIDINDEGQGPDIV